MRDAFSAALIKVAQQDERVLLLTGDHGYALFDDIRRLLPDRYLNVGVAEQNMVGVAAGLAKAGLRPEDLIVGLDGSPVENVGDLQRLMTAERIDRSVPVEIVRFGERSQLEVRPTELKG